MKNKSFLVKALYPFLILSSLGISISLVSYLSALFKLDAISN